jgi:DNA-directed RNA polymerase specialized sigma24 family protein
MPMPHKATSFTRQPASRVGEVFVEKYDQLLHWALRLTHRDREQAEDLLHEAFVHFTLRQLDFTGVENIDGYLYTVLKHFHLSTLRRAKHDPLNQISLVEFDSVALALRSTFDFDQVEVQNDLRRICAFLCWRKASAKSASYLILRFFHGYYPEEITRVALTSRNVVDHGIRLASSEAKVCLTEPGRLRFMPGRTKDKQTDESSAGTAESVPDFVPILFAIPAADFLHALSQIIFGSRVDGCLPKEELLHHYERPSEVQGSANEESTASIDRTLLAHLVSCPPCLDTVNDYLQMPPLSGRFPGERLGSYRPSIGKGGSAVRKAPKGTGSQMSNEQALQEMQLAKDSILRIAQTRLRECFEHQPKKLFVAVNGDIVATQDVASDHNKQSVRLNGRKTVDFVEVFSEQGIRLAFISVVSAPPEGPDTLSQKVSLSAGRYLETVLEFTSSGTLLEVVYSDPLLAHSVDFLEAELDQSLQLIADLKTSIEASSEIPARKTQPLLVPLREKWSEWVDTFRPLAISGAIAILLAVVTALYFAHSRYKAQEARTLLAEVALQESVSLGKGRIAHRVLEFEIASQDGEQVIQRGTVDVWKRVDQNRLAMRLTAQDGKLQAGIWKAADGSYSLYRDRKLADHAAVPDNLHGAVAPDDADDLWMNEPSASRFETLAANQGTVTVQKSGDDSVIDYRPEQRVANANRPHLVRATLTVRGTRHVLGQMFWIESSGEIRRYSYQEVSYEEREGAASDAGVFTPDGTLSGGHAKAGHGLTLPRDSSVFLAHLNLEAFALLNTVNADSGEQITVKRTASQHLSISGVLPSSERLAQVKGALTPLEANPMVDIALESAYQQNQQAATSNRHKAAPAFVTAENYEINAAAVPAQDRLKAYYSLRGHSGKDLDHQIETFSQATLGHSSRALQQAWTLHTLASSFSMHDWQHMSLNDRKQWIALYLRHSTALQSELQALRQSLDVLSVTAYDISDATNNATDNEPLPMSGQVSLNALSDQLLEQSSVADRVLRSALTASTGSLPDLDALCKQLKVSLRDTDRTIREIEHRAQDLEDSQSTR